MQVPDTLSRRHHTITGTGTNLSPLLHLTNREADHLLEIQIDKDTQVLLTLKNKTIALEDLQTPYKFDNSKDKEFSSIFNAIKTNPKIVDTHPKYLLYSINGNKLI